MAYKLIKPYTAKQYADFIVLHNHQNGRKIEEGVNGELFALEPYEKLVNGEVIDNTQEYEQEQAIKEAERIAMLNLTAADVERAIYKAKGFDFNDVISLVENQKAAIDIKALQIELKANNFYRGNPYIDAVGTILGFTKEQLDKFFDTNDYRYLTTCKLKVNAIPEEAVIKINSEAKNTVTVPYGDTVEYSVAAEGYLTQSGTVELTEDTTLDIELVKEGVNEGGIEEPPIEEETAEEENVNNENDYSQNEGENVNNEVEDENTTDTTTDTNNGDEVEAEPTGDVDKE
jgi:hypothetical protein|nr:MAG TPA: hypothetical protein [Caudoviricetes sp.]